MFTTTDHNILIIKHGSIGDFVLSLGAIKTIRKNFPNSKIILLTTSQIKNIFEKNPYVDQICIDNRKSFKDVFIYLRILKKLKINFVFDLQNSKRTEIYHLFTRFFASSIKVNSSRKFSHFRYLIPEHGTEHVSEGLNNQLRLTNIKNFFEPELQWLVNKNFKNPYDSNYVLLIPGTSRRGYNKQWPSNFFSELSKNILNKGYKVLITGSDADLSQINEIIKFCPRAINVKNLSTFPEFLNLCQSANLIISVDTGPAHMAALTGAPMIWLVQQGPYTVTNKPISKKLHIITSKKMSLISVEDVYSKVLEILN